jgi:hypothetical protein
MGQKLIAGGAWVQVIVDGDPIGLATNASYDEDWAVNPANVLNYLGPCDYDSQGYSCTITMGAFVPEIPGAGNLPDGGTKSLHDYLTTRRVVQQGGGKPGEFNLLQFVNTSTGEILNQFRKVLLASNGTQISPNSYVTSNIRFMSVERTI